MEKNKEIVEACSWYPKEGMLGILDFERTAGTRGRNRIDNLQVKQYRVTS